MIFTITFLIIGLLLIVAGYKFSKEPGRRNYYYGFRNSLTMNSHHAWREVNIYGGKQTLKWGILFFVLSPLGFIISNELSIIIGILFPVTFAYGLNSSVSKYMNTLFDSDGNRLLDKSLEINKELDQNIKEGNDKNMYINENVNYDIITSNENGKMINLGNFDFYLSSCENENLTLTTETKINTEVIQKQITIMRGSNLSPIETKIYTQTPQGKVEIVNHFDDTKSRITVYYPEETTSNIELKLPTNCFENSQVYLLIKDININNPVKNFNIINSLIGKVLQCECSFIKEENLQIGNVSFTCNRILLKIDNLEVPYQYFLVLKDKPYTILKIVVGNQILIKKEK